TTPESGVSGGAVPRARAGAGPGPWLYPAAALLSVLITALLLQLQRADLRVPFAYSGDAMFYSMMIKGISDNGWYLRNNFIGMPSGADLQDFPVPDTFNFLLIKAATLLTSDHALILNLFYLLTFPLTTLAALYVLRRLRVSALPALLAGLLYTFTTYHLSRGQHHLMYTAYYAVPLIVLVILWATAGEVKGRGRWVFSLAACVLIASTGGVYYSFFACYLLLVAGLFLAVFRRRAGATLAPLLLAGAIFATLFANLSPSIFYRLRHGTTDTAQRVPAEAETFGLKIAQLLLPVTGHRVPALAELKGQYNANPLVTENDDATLGLIGSLGFLLLLGRLLANGAGAARARADEPDRVLSRLSLLNLAALLLATIGGFGALFNLLVSPQIRAYNRVSVYVAFFSLSAVALRLDRAARRRPRTGRQRIAFGVLVALFIPLGVLDQTSPRFVPDYATVRAEYQSDADFGRRVEAAAPPGAMIFQLPVRRFPEAPPTERLYDYDLFKGYLHTQRLRWSYGALRGREGEAWQKQVVARPTAEMVETVALAGFGGIYLDRFGYADNGAGLEAELAGLLGAGPLASANGRLAFFDLAPYQRRLRERFGAAELEARREAALHPLLLSWAGGFSTPEGTPEENWRWCGPAGELQFDNRLSRGRRVTIEGSFATAQEANLSLEGGLVSARLRVGPDARPFSQSFTVPPGIHTIKFACDGPRVDAPTDPRVMVFRVNNFKVIVAE
ncbi:MAG TPA: hypothetical protein VFC61_11405, partial [Blastocatellia bacterium]|nr:hypothetical protein [Blastocatellia bacterium]